MSAPLYTFLSYGLTLGGMVGLGVYSFILYRRALKILQHHPSEDHDVSFDES